MNRRTARIAGLAALTAAASLALAGCAAGTPAPSGSAGGTGAFTYTDARGEEINLDTVPKTVVAQASVAAALWDAGFHVAGAYGELTPVNGELDYQSGELDLSQLKVLGSTWGEFDVEEYALMNPELLVDYSFDGSSLWYVPAEQESQIFALAPSLAVPGNYSDTTVAIETMVDLAAKLGADTDAATADAKADYEAALDAVSETAAASGLKVLFVSGDANSLYIVNQPQLPEATTLANAGLDVQGPKSGDTSQVFTQLSWEQAADYADADVILFDARVYGSIEDTLASIPTWTSLPAVQAGQVYAWYAGAPYSYRAYGEIFQEIADELAAAKDL